MIEAPHLAKAVVVLFQRAPGCVRHRLKVILEVWKTKTPMVGHPQCAEVVKLLFFGQEDFRMALQVVKQPRCPGPLWSDNQEVGKVAQRGVRVGDADRTKLCPKIVR